MTDRFMNQFAPIQINASYCTAIEQLVQITKAAGDNLFNGTTKLALTAAMLAYVNFGINKVLCDGVEKHSRDRLNVLSKESLILNLRHLHEVIQKCTGLKLTHGHQTLQGNVTISLFCNLQVLEIRRIPVHLLVGLKDLQHKLTTIICARSLQTLKELFESCGSDEIHATVWQKLNIAVLSYNNIEVIDESVELLPNLEILDLSHNNINNFENFSVMTKLKYLNLSFNQLDAFPLPPHKIPNLRCLILRNNTLDKLDGLSMLCQLEQLDLGYNCLSHHSSLNPLRALSSLKMVLLDGNPLCHHHQHRKLTVEHLHPAVMLVKFSLDGQYLNGNEISYLKKGIEFAEEGIWPPVFIGDDRQSINSSIHSLENSYNSGSQQSLTNSTTQRRKKMRKVEFHDTDSAAKSSYEQPSPDASANYLKTKDELEKLRLERGSHWLVASTRMNSPKVLPSNEITKAETVEKKYVNTQPNTIMQNVETVAYKNKDKSSPVEVHEISETQSNISDHSSTSDGINNNVVLPVIAITGAHPGYQNDDDVYVSNNFASTTDLKELDSDLRVLTVTSPYTVPDDDNENESCSFIVESKTANKQATLILILMGNFLCEKNLNGQNIGKLDLRCLVSSERQSRIQNCCLLTFQSVRKNHRERTYVFENQAAYKEFQNLIQPIIEENIMKEMTEGAYQCFKCEAQFSKEVAVVAIQQDKTGKSENVKVCPNCGSNMIMEVDKAPLPSTAKMNDAVNKKSNLIQSSKSASSAADLMKGSSTGVSSRSQSLTLGSDQIIKPSVPIVRKKMSEHMLNKSSSSAPNTPSHGKNRFDEILKRQQQKVQLESTTRNELFNSYKDPKNSSSQTCQMGSKTCGHSTSHVLDDSSSFCSELELREKTRRLLEMTAVSDLLFQEVCDNIPNAEDNNDALSDTVDGTADSAMEKNVMLASEQELNVVNLTTSEDKSHTQPLNCGLKRCESDITILSNFSQSSISGLSTPNTDLLGLNSITEAAWDAQRQAFSSTLHLKNIPFCSSPTSALSGSEEDTHTLGKEDSPSIAAISDTESFNSNCATSEENLQNTCTEETSPTSHTSAGTKLYDTSSQSTVYSADPDLLCSSESTYQSAESSSMLSDERNSSTPKKRDKNSARLKNSPENSSPFTVPSEPNVSQESENGVKVNKSVRFAYEDFTQVDHRIHLYLEMKVFQEGERFDSVLKTNIQLLGKGTEFSGLLILSNVAAYIYKIVGKEMTEPKKWMEKVEVFPLATLSNICLHLGSQAFSFEFANSSSKTVCLFLLRDSYRCNNYFGYLTGCIKQQMKWNVTGDSLEVISLSQEMMTSLQAVITNYMLNTDQSEPTYDVQLYLMGFQINHDGSLREPMSFVVASYSIFMIKENLSCRTNLTSTDVNCFEIDRHENINDIIQLTLFLDATNRMELKFLREEDGVEFDWQIAMETEAAVSSFVNILKDIWEKLFGIELPTLFQTLDQID